MLCFPVSFLYTLELMPISPFCNPVCHAEPLTLYITGLSRMCLCQALKSQSHNISISSAAVPSLKALSFRHDVRNCYCLLPHAENLGCTKTRSEVEMKVVVIANDKHILRERQSVYSTAPSYHLLPGWAQRSKNC